MLDQTGLCTRVDRVQKGCNKTGMRRVCHQKVGAVWEELSLVERGRCPHCQRCLICWDAMHLRLE